MKKLDDTLDLSSFAIRENPYTVNDFDSPEIALSVMTFPSPF